MPTLAWILLSGVMMSVIALVGRAFALLGEARARRVFTEFVAFSAGSLVGGALFHLIPAALAGAAADGAFVWVAAGFLAFLAVEQFLHWHHCHRATATCRSPLTWLILVGDGVHNLLGGLAIGATFVADVRLGVTAWCAAALHEIPQELGDYAVLVHGGWTRRGALTANFLSGLTFLVGGVAAWALARDVDVAWLVPLGAGNFLYIGASDLVPEVNKPRTLRDAALHFLAFAAGLAAVGAFGAHGHA